MMRHPWTLYLAVGIGSLAATLLLTPLCRRLALRLDVVDRPNARKVHTRSVPYLGGLPFYFCFLGVILALEVWRPEFSQPVLFPMALLGTIIVLMGLYDDVRDMSSFAKLVIELIITLALCLWGFRAAQIAHPLGGAWQLGLLALIITPLWIVGVMNAVNFSDGLDGLAAGLVFICAATLFAISLRANQVFSCVIMAYLMGTTLGFLRYNFHPASVFMGDTGALFLGFVLATSAMVQQQKGVTIIALAVPMVVIAVPIVDTALSFLRRLQRAREGQFFSPDRNHLHHRLLDLGLSQVQVVLALYYISACMGLLAFILSVAPPHYGFLILILAAMAICFGVVVLRFIENMAISPRPPKP